MKTLALIAVLIAAAVAGLAIYMRTVASDPEEWHVDPSAATAPDSPNFVLLQGDDAPVVAGAPDEVFARVDAAMMAKSGAKRLVGSPNGTFATYLQRTALMGYPDYISIKVTSAGTDAPGLAPGAEGSRIEIFSRSRFGRSDFGVNAKRVDALLAAIGEGGPERRIP